VAQATNYRVKLMQTDVAVFVFVKNVEGFPPSFNLFFAVLVVRLMKEDFDAFKSQKSSTVGLFTKNLRLHFEYTVIHF
jgi:hypothetical protein